MRLDTAGHGRATSFYATYTFSIMVYFDFDSEPNVRMEKAG